MDLNPQSVWLTAAEAAAYLKVKPRTILKWAKQGTIPAHALSGCKRVTQTGASDCQGGELYLQAASFQRMWVKATLIVGPQALRPVASPSTTLLDQWNEIGRKLIAMAEDFPEDKYDYKPSASTRSFAERLIHAASANYFFINSALGQKLPGDEDPPRACCDGSADDRILTDVASRNALCGRYGLDIP